LALITYLVEDNPTLLDNLIGTLEEIASVKVVGHAATEAEATRWLLLHGGQWQLAVIDLFLREGSGLGVLASCRQREPHQKMVVLSNYATPDIRRRSLELGANAVFDQSSELEEFFAYCLAQETPLTPGVGVGVPPLRFSGE
jgi:DNA-binding NarL/FixJ family response regulator